jgi:hypothetical protein
MAGYGDDATFTAWLASSGYVLPVVAGTPSKEALRQRGSDWVDGEHAALWTGTPTQGINQERAWPRTGATAFGAPIPDDLIPPAVIHASFAAAYQEALSPGLLATALTDASRVKRQKVDVIEVEYADPPEGSDGIARMRLNAVSGLLAPLLKKSSTALGAFIYSVGG